MMSQGKDNCGDWTLWKVHLQMKLSCTSSFFCGVNYELHLFSSLKRKSGTVCYSAFERAKCADHALHGGGPRDVIGEGQKIFVRAKLFVSGCS